MTLEELSTVAGNVLGKSSGFVIKSLVNPDRRFTVAYRFANGDYGITRHDTGKNYVVDGAADRYDFALPVERIREVKVAIAELTEQKKVVDGELFLLENELNGYIS